MSPYPLAYECESESLLDKKDSYHDEPQALRRPSAIRLYLTHAGLFLVNVVWLAANGINTTYFAQNKHLSGQSDNSKWGGKKALEKLDPHGIEALNRSHRAERCTHRDLEG
jgi:hypothetical protein